MKNNNLHWSSHITLIQTWCETLLTKLNTTEQSNKLLKTIPVFCKSPVRQSIQRPQNQNHLCLTNRVSIQHIDFNIVFSLYVAIFMNILEKSFMKYLSNFQFETKFNLNVFCNTYSKFHFLVWRSSPRIADRT